MSVPFEKRTARSSSIRVRREEAGPSASRMRSSLGLSVPLISRVISLQIQFREEETELRLTESGIGFQLLLGAGAPAAEQVVKDPCLIQFDVELLGNGVEVPGDHSAPVVEIQPVGERPVLRQQELSAALLSEFPDVGHNGEVDRVGAYSQEVPVDERSSQLVFRVGEDLPEKPVIVPDDGGLHLHGGLDVQILLYQGTLGEDVVVDGGFQNSYGLRMLQIVQVEDHVLAVTDFRIHADVVLFNDVPSVQFVPEDTVIQICRGKKHLIRVLAESENILFLYGSLTGDFISHHPVEIADNKVGRAVFRAADQQLGRFGSEPVICVTELDVIPRCAVKTGIPCSGNSAVFLVDAQDAGIFRRLPSSTRMTSRSV